MTGPGDELNRLLAEEITRRLPALEAEASQASARDALGSLKSAAALARHHELALVLTQLDARLRAGDDSAREAARSLLRDVPARLARGEPPFETAWPVPPPGLEPSQPDPRYRDEYLAAMRDRLAELDAILASDQAPEDALTHAYRSAHAMKGAVSAAGDDTMAWYCHGLEAWLKAARAAESAAPALITELPRHRGALSLLLERPRDALATLRAAADPAEPHHDAPPRSEPAPASPPLPEPPRTDEADEPLRATLERVRASWLFERVAHGTYQLAARGERSVTILMSGGDTPVDRHVAARLLDPLMQLVRNALAHGVEPIDERRRAGKPPLGTIALHAERRGHQLRLTVEDDGRGVDLARVRELAVRSGALTREGASVLHDDELLALLFTPGITTREGADLLAGRGVGLDLAQHAVRRLGGAIQLRLRTGGGLQATIELPSERGSGKLR